MLWPPAACPLDIAVHLERRVLDAAAAGTSLTPAPYSVGNFFDLVVVGERRRRLALGQRELARRDRGHRRAAVRQPHLANAWPPPSPDTPSAASSPEPSPKSSPRSRTRRRNMMDARPVRRVTGSAASGIDDECDTPMKESRRFRCRELHGRPARARRRARARRAARAPAPAPPSPVVVADVKATRKIARWDAARPRSRRRTPRAARAQGGADQLPAVLLTTVPRPTAPEGTPRRRSSSRSSRRSSRRGGRCVLSIAVDRRDITELEGRCASCASTTRRRAAKDGGAAAAPSWAEDLADSSALANLGPEAHADRRSTSRRR